MPRHRSFSRKLGQLPQIITVKDPVPSPVVVYTAVFDSGERFPVLLDKNTGQPIILPTRYVIDCRRDRRQASTIERDVRVLGWLYEWASTVQIDLEVRLRRGPPVTATEVPSFARFLRHLRPEKVAGSVIPRYRRKEDGEAGPAIGATVFNA